MPTSTRSFGVTIQHAGIVVPCSAHAATKKMTPKSAGFVRTATSVSASSTARPLTVDGCFWCSRGTCRAGQWHYSCSSRSWNRASTKHPPTLLLNFRAGDGDVWKTPSPSIFLLSLPTASESVFFFCSPPLSIKKRSWEDIFRESDTPGKIEHRESGSGAVCPRRPRR